MYDFIRGRLVSATPFYATVETHGVGYKLSIATAHLSKLPAPGEEILLHTSLVVRENEQTLYGFLTTQDRDLFELFNTISGIGPKTSLGIVGNLSPLALQEAIAHDNPALLAKVPGIGKKTAQRLIVELRDKLPAVQTRPSDLSPTVRDAMSALLNLGYTQAKAQTAVQRILKESETPPDLSTLITSALRSLQK